MPSIQRPLSGDVMKFDIQRELAIAGEGAERSGRSARTLLKEDSLRVTLVVLAPGGELAEHHAPGPITVQPLQGRIRFTTDGQVHEVGPGALLALGPNVRHSVTSDEGASFLLTLSIPGNGGGA
ncbi:MAG TPA: cupin domain-containing protein [Longimicrobiales bacterium]|nr:cupin domain-containing protein [Longimicrobiales bacterium]